MKNSVKRNSIWLQIWYGLAMVVIPVALSVAIAFGYEIKMSALVGITYFVTFFGCILISGRKAYKELNSLDGEWLKKTVNYGSKFIAISYLLETVVSAVSLRIFPEAASVSLNQQLCNLIMIENPVVSVVSMGIMAPIMEEMVFRWSIFHLFKPEHKKWALWVSSILFGIMHLTLSVTDLVFIPLYCGLGFVLGKIYYDTDDIRITTAIHLFNNTFEVLVSLI